MIDTLTAIGIVLAGAGRYLEEKSGQSSDNPALRIALGGARDL